MKTRKFFLLSLIFVVISGLAIAQSTPTTTTTTATTPTPAATTTPSTTTPAVTPTTTPSTVPTLTPPVTETTVAQTPVATPAAPASSSGYSHQGKVSVGLGATGFYNFYSNFDSLYVDFGASAIKTAGFGFQTYIEYGFSDRFTGTFDLGFQRLTYSNKFRPVINENFFVTDFMGNYYFLDNSKIRPYATAGAGMIISSGAVAPTGNLGIGTHIRLADEFSLKVQVLYKTSIIQHVAEGTVGFAYHFK